jgi:hypothetical protein
MRRLLVGLLVVLALVAGVGALGYSRGWFTVSTADKDKAIPIDVKVNREKVKEDTDKVKAKVNDVTTKDKGKGEEPSGNKAKKEEGAKEGGAKGPGGE